MKRLQKKGRRVMGLPLFGVGLAVCGALLSFASGRAFPQGGAAPQTNRSSAGNAQNGKELYTKVGCYECHGRLAEGAVAPRLGPRLITLEFLISYVRQPRGEMPPYTSKVMSDAELTDIYAFLQSLPDPPKVEDIPLLKY